ncbi:MAG: DMT family transporter [Rhizobiaceae bacterium]
MGSSSDCNGSRFHTLCAQPFVFCPIFFRVSFALPNGKTLLVYFIRGTTHAVAVSLWFFALSRIPITEVIAIGYTVPIYVSVGAALFLGEKLTLNRLVTVIVGFVGAMIILRPGIRSIDSGTMAQMVAAIVFAGSFLMAKRLSDRENPVMIVAMLSVFASIALLPGAIMQWKTPSLTELFWLGVIALLATFGNFAQIKAFQVAPITVTQPVWFLRLVWAAILGWLVFDEIIDPFVLGGGAIIILAVAYTSYREAQFPSV